MTFPAGAVEQPLEPLWRGLVVYRVLTLASAVVVAGLSLDEYARPGVAVAVLVVMAGWTAATAWGYALRPLGSRPAARGEPAPRDRRGLLAVADLAVTVAVMATTPLVQTPAQLAADAPVMGSIWTPGAALACALAYGVAGGLAGAAVLSAALVAVSARLGTEVGDILLVVLTALTVGFAATVLRRSAERVRRAVAEAAAAAERERLARAVHDGVLQVLAHVKRRGTQLGGDAAELGSLAGEQEIALRTLLITGPSVADAEGRRDLAAALRGLASGRVTVAAPAHPVPLPARDVDELVAAVAAALANTALHAGSAQAWVFLEDAGDAVEISVRDDGPGIPDGRLAAAEAEGRIGVARSIRGRVADLGGTITLDTGPDRGTEWTITVTKR
ncbi:MacS family sensor histidine kinase [Pseudonocardia sp.]|uniref:MacS family sensor histidine kinase n=1 Tax=Pseudonocardia sp. TaxID=60912 RepID=UPI003D138B22